MAATSPITAASDIQTNYMTLLVTQLQNQDPMDPMDNNQMSTQLTLFSQLEQLESLNTSFGKALASAQGSYANSLLGKQISFADSENTSTGTSSGVVSQVSLNADGEPVLTVGTRTVALNDVLSVQNVSTTTKAD